jgi:hypothetical protein
MSHHCSLNLLDLYLIFYIFEKHQKEARTKINILFAFALSCRDCGEDLVLYLALALATAPTSLHHCCQVAYF